MADNKNGYKTFFKAAQKAKGQTPSAIKNQSRKTDRSLADLAKMMKKNSTKHNRPFPVSPLIILVVGFGLTVWALNDVEKLETWFSKIEISALGMASAEDAKKDTKAAKTDGTKGENAEKSASSEGPAKKAEAAKQETWTPEQLSFFNKLEEKKKQLDQREAELAKLEEELQQQKVLLEKRLGELDQLRTKIASRLDEKVKVDQEKVDKLVEFYSNMKPQSAAKVFEDIDEDLAIEILAKMKKKSAADIMNLLKPEKAQKLSEKFAGYKKG